MSPITASGYFVGCFAVLRPIDFPRSNKPLASSGRVEGFADIGDVGGARMRKPPNAGVASGAIQQLTNKSIA
jgi:hypothetical protein